MTRKEELLQAVENDITLTPLIEEMVYLEGELDALRALPKIKVHPKDPSKQKPTPAAKLYKEFLQQYNNCIKILLGVLGKIESTETSPLREYLNRMRAAQ
jgi:hypothetical protein